MAGRFLAWVPTVPLSNSLTVADSLHLWVADLSPKPFSNSTIETWLATTLSNHEQKRAARARCRTGFVASRVFLRQVLSAYVPVSPASIHLCSRTRGKPFIAECHGAPEFSLTHTDNVAVVAVADPRWPVGIDLEPHDRLVRNMDRMKSRFMTNQEQQWVGTSSKRFLEIWVAKEAVVKGTGEGIAGNVRLADFCVAQRECTTLIGQTWHLRRFRDLPFEAERYIGAVALPHDIENATSSNFIWQPHHP